MFRCVEISFAVACLVIALSNWAEGQTDSCEMMPPFVTDPPDPCRKLICIEGQWHEILAECPDVQCVDSVLGDDHCCRTCPYGPNCEKEGVVIPMDTVVTMENGEQCQCVQEGRGQPTTLCVDVPVPEY